MEMNSSLIFFVIVGAAISCAKICSDCQELYIVEGKNNRTAYVGGNYSYNCASNTTTNFTWMLNDSMINELNFSIRVTTGTNRSRLHLDCVSKELNETNITCIGQFCECYCMSTPKKLFLQGIPSPVSNLEAHLDASCSYNNTLQLQWAPAYTLDVDQNEIDVHYRVNITCKSLMSEIDYISFDESSNYTAVFLYDCIICNVTVTPYNRVGCGVSDSTTNMSIPQGIHSVEVMYGEYVGSQIIYTLVLRPTSCLINISLHNKYNTSDEIITPTIHINATYMCYNETIFNINLDSESKKNTIFDVAYSLNELDEMFAMNTLSTYDIQDSNVHGNPPVLNITYLNNSPAQGALLMTADNDSPPMFIALPKYQSQNYILPSFLKGRTLWLYDIEENGTLNIGKNYPAKAGTALGIKTDKTPNLNTSDCSALLSDFTFVVNCSCHSSKIGYHLLIRQQNDSFGILYANSSFCSNQYTLVQVEVTLYDVYHVTVFSIKERFIDYKGMYLGNWTITSHDQKNDNTGIIVGSTVSGVILLIIVECVVEVILLVCWKRCRHDPEKKKGNSSEYELEQVQPSSS